MARHLWRDIHPVRICEICLEHQLYRSGAWTPQVNMIYSGNQDDGGGHCITRCKPLTPAGTPRLLEECT